MPVISWRPRPNTKLQKLLQRHQSNLKTVCLYSLVSFQARQKSTHTCNASYMLPLNLPSVLSECILEFKWHT